MLEGLQWCKQWWCPNVIVITKKGKKVTLNAEHYFIALSAHLPRFPFLHKNWRGKLVDCTCIIILFFSFLLYFTFIMDFSLKVNFTFHPYKNCLSYLVALRKSASLVLFIVYKLWESNDYTMCKSWASHS